MPLFRGTAKAVLHCPHRGSTASTSTMHFLHSPTPLRRVACLDSHCARPTSTFLACALREHRRPTGSPIFSCHFSPTSPPRGVAEAALDCAHRTTTIHLNDPSKLARVPSLGRAPMLVYVRPSNEALLRARVPGAQDQRGCPSSFFSFDRAPSSWLSFLPLDSTLT